MINKEVLIVAICYSLIMIPGCRNRSDDLSSVKAVTPGKAYQKTSWYQSLKNNPQHKSAAIGLDKLVTSLNSRWHGAGLVYFQKGSDGNLVKLESPDGATKNIIYTKMHKNSPYTYESEVRKMTNKSVAILTKARDDRRQGEIVETLVQKFKITDDRDFATKMIQDSVLKARNFELKMLQLEEQAIRNHSATTQSHIKKGFITKIVLAIVIASVTSIFVVLGSAAATPGVPTTFEFVILFLTGASILLALPTFAFFKERKEKTEELREEVKQSLEHNKYLNELINSQSSM